jgi:AraC family transcriptional regulator
MDYSERIQNSVDFIEEKLCEKLDLSQLADRIYLSKYYFHRIFHSIVGESVAEYIRKRRLSKAAEDLRSTDDRLVDIALRYQFGSQESFSRAFKKVFGITPNEYRKSNNILLLHQRITIKSQISIMKAKSTSNMNLAA